MITKTDRFHLHTQSSASCRKARRQQTYVGKFLRSHRTWTLIYHIYDWSSWNILEILAQFTCVRCLSNIGVSEPKTVLQAGIHFVISAHRNVHWTGKRYIIYVSMYLKNQIITSRVGKEFPPLQKCDPFCRLCTRAVWMYTILSAMWG